MKGEFIPSYGFLLEENERLETRVAHLLLSLELILQLDTVNAMRSECERCGESAKIVRDALEE